MGEKGKKILKAILIHKKIIIITILILIAFFILLIPAVIHMITLDDGSYDEGNNSNVPYVVSNDYLNNVKFNENGIYFEKEEKKKDEKTGEEKTVTTKVTYQDIWDDLTSKDSCLENYLFNAEELAKLMNAQVITQYPYLSTLDPGLSTEKGTLNGTVKFERHKTDGTTSMLEYVNYNSFQKMIEENNSAVLGKFTLDENNNLVIGVKDKTTETLTYNDPETKLSDYAELLTEQDKQGGNTYSRINETYTSRTINYQNAISQYVMPFQYLWSFLVISDCKDFVFELADLVEGSEIVISIFDNVTTTEVVEVDEYKRETRDNKYARLSVSPSGVISKKTDRYWVPSDDSRYEGYNAIEATNGPYKVTHTSIYESNTPSFDVTTADVWIVDLKKVYESETKVETYTDVNKIEDKEFEKISEENPGPLSDSNAVAFRNEYQQALQRATGSNTSTSTTESSVSVSYVSIDHYARLKDRVKTTTTTTTTQNYVKKSNNIREKTDPTADEDSFVTIFLRPYFQNARSQILGILDWLFEMLENNPDTVNMVDLTKYLLYKATGNDYGVTEYDFSEYEDNTFSDISSDGSVVSDFLKSWEFNALWQYMNGKSGYSSYLSKYVTKDKTQYICFADDTAQKTRNYGYGVCHLANIGQKNYMHVSEYAEYGIKITSGNYDQLGVSKIDATIVDGVKEKLILNFKKSIINELSRKGIKDLTDAQIDALVAVKYQYGNIGNFAEMYKKYGNTDKLKETASANGAVNSHYFVEVKPGGDYARRRAAANWKLFHEGIYETPTGEKLNPDSYTGTANGDFLQTAQKVWKTVSTSGKFSTYGGVSSIPPKGPTIDCSAFVSWVLYEYGYKSQFKNQNTTQVFYNTNWKNKYGWEEISIGAKENAIPKLQPGDILVRYNGSVHHVSLAVEVQSNKVMAYDCGSSKANWNNTNGRPLDKTNFFKAANSYSQAPGKIIRVKPPK